MVQIITDASFASDIAQGITLVDFYADWCGPCRVMIPRLEELQQKVGSTAKITKINVDNDPNTAAAFGIMSIPTMILFKDGKAVEKIVGVQEVKNLEAMIAKYSV